MGNIRVKNYNKNRWEWEEKGKDVGNKKRLELKTKCWIPRPFIILLNTVMHYKNSKERLEKHTQLPTILPQQQ